MSIPPIPPIGTMTQAQAATAARAPEAAPGFAETLADGLAEASRAEQRADAVAMDVATGGPSQVHDLMVATSQSQVATDLVLAVRNRAVEAYQEIMRLPV